jgi:glycosyltransferase involved in cell wall biosynthesis
MKISIITVAYNGEQTISNTIESICGQTFLTHEECLLEYLIIDGNSSDRTVAVAESYRDRLEKAGVSYIVVSEPDKGIYDAMNKGIRLASGDVIGIINSDDWYEQDALDTVRETFESRGCELMYADIRVHREDGRSFVKKAKLRNFETSRDWNHPTTFVRADIYKENPFRNLGIHDDYGFFLQMKKQNRKIAVVDKVLANFRMGGASNNKSFKAAKKRIKDRYLYCYRINGYSRLYIIECIAIEAAKWILG